jgi:hypothetical protein
MRDDKKERKLNEAIKVARKFLKHPEREKIEKRGKGCYCVLIPNSLSNYPRRKYPEFYLNGRLPEFQCQGKKYILVACVPFNVTEKALTIKGKIRVPRTYKRKPIEEFLT